MWPKDHLRTVCIHKAKSWNLVWVVLIYSPNKSIESESEVAQMCPTLCDPMDCSLPGSSLNRILQARVLEWVAISFSRGSCQPRDQTRVSRIPGRHCNLWATREAQVPVKCQTMENARVSVQQLVKQTDRHKYKLIVKGTLKNQRTVYFCPICMNLNKNIQAV